MAKNDTTTVRVNTCVRDELRDVGVRTAQSTSEVITAALRVYKRELFWAEGRTAIATRTPEQLRDDFAAGLALSDATLADWTADEGR
jgi:hypothetical protein